MIISKIFLSFRYCCYPCDLSLCSSCANKEGSLLTRKPSKLLTQRSRRSSTATEQLIFLSPRRSSHVIHPANLPNLRRLSAVSHPHNQSSRRSSRCDERCLSRRSSNIHHIVPNKKDHKDSPTESVGNKCDKESSNIPMDKSSSKILVKVIVEEKPSHSNDKSSIQAVANAYKDEKIVESKDMSSATVLLGANNLEKLPLPQYYSESVRPPALGSNNKRRHSTMNLLESSKNSTAGRRNSCVTLPREPVSMLMNQNSKNPSGI